MPNMLIAPPKPKARGLSGHDIYVEDGVDTRPVFARAQEYADKLNRPVVVSYRAIFARHPKTGITPAPRRVCRKFVPNTQEG